MTFKCANCSKLIDGNPTKGAFCSAACHDKYERTVASKKVLCGIVCRDTITTQTFTTLPGPIFSNIKVNTGWPLDQARNEIVRYFLNNKELTHLMWVDSDVVLPQNMHELLKIDAPCVAPLCWIGGPVKSPSTGETFYMPIPGLYRWNENSSNTVFTTWSVQDIKEEVGKAKKEKRAPVVDVDLVGGGVWMIDRKTAEELTDNTGNWFRITWEENGKLRHGEDVYFFEGMRKRGMKFKVHLGVECGHMKQIDLRYFGHAMYGMLPSDIYENIDDKVSER